MTLQEGGRIAHGRALLDEASTEGDLERAAPFGVPTDPAALARHYTLGPDDLDFLLVRRGEVNRLGAAAWLALLRHPGFGLRPDETAPPELVGHLADQLGVSDQLLDAYGRRSKTRLEHGWEVAAHLGPPRCSPRSRAA